MSALRALSARQREVVVLRYFADLPEAEIAAATGMSMAAVRDHAAQAMSSLQAELGNEWRSPVGRREATDYQKIMVDRGFGVDLVHYRPPNQP